MNQEDVQKLSNAANAKITLLKNDFFKYFMRAIMAGFFIVVAMIFSNVVGNVFSGAEEPAWGKFLGALVFSIAVLLISLVGGELFTGNNLVMAFGAFDKKISWGDAAKVWVVSYIGNFVGCLILSLIFVWAGASGTGDYFAGFINNKLTIPVGQMFFRAVLCNFFVCCHNMYLPCSLIMVYLNWFGFCLCKSSQVSLNHRLWLDDLSNRNSHKNHMCILIP